MAFRSGSRPPGFGERLGRLRWRRASGAGTGIEWGTDTPASPALSGAPAWVLVGDAAAIPLGEIPEPPQGMLALGRAATLAPRAFAHTLRELTTTLFDPAEGQAVAVGFRTVDFPPAPGETFKDLFERLLDSEAARKGVSFPVLTLPDPSERERLGLCKCG